MADSLLGNDITVTMPSELNVISTKINEPIEVIINEEVDLALKVALQLYTYADFEKIVNRVDFALKCFERANDFVKAYKTFKKKGILINPLNKPLSPGINGEGSGTTNPDSGNEGGTTNPDSGNDGGTTNPDSGNEGGTPNPDSGNGGSTTNPDDNDNSDGSNENVDAFEFTILNYRNEPLNSALIKYTVEHTDGVDDEKYEFVDDNGKATIFINQYSDRTIHFIIEEQESLSHEFYIYDTDDIREFTITLQKQNVDIV